MKANWEVWESHRIIQEFYIQRTIGAFKFWVYKSGKSEYYICHESGMLINSFPFKKLKDMEASIAFAIHMVQYMILIKWEDYLLQQINNQEKRAESIYCPF